MYSPKGVQKKFVMPIVRIGKLTSEAASFWFNLNCIAIPSNPGESMPILAFPNMQKKQMLIRTAYLGF